MLAIAFAVLVPVPSEAPETVAAEAGYVRLKDITRVVGLGRHKLVGYGLVVGLDGTGDGRRAEFTPRAVANMLEQFGLTVAAEDLQLENTASVIATAELGPEAELGQPADVTVASLADAESLQGGVLLMTPLQGADGEIYVIAQGPVSIGGFNIQAGGDKVQKNHAVVGRVVGGGSVVRAIEDELPRAERLALALNRPDHTTASRIADALNERHGQPVASARSAAIVELTVPAEKRDDLVAFLDETGNTEVQPDTSARVVINERTGTIVIGDNVRLLPVAIAHGSLTVEIRSETEVSQPALAFAREATTAIVDNTDVRVSEQGGTLVELDARALRDLVRGLNTLGIKPRDLIAILQALRAANALQAEIELL